MSGLWQRLCATRIQGAIDVEDRAQKQLDVSELFDGELGTLVPDDVTSLRVATP
jgi:hypothetical protein